MLQQQAVQLLFDICQLFLFATAAQKRHPIELFVIDLGLKAAFPGEQDGVAALPNIRLALVQQIKQPSRSRQFLNL